MPRISSVSSNSQITRVDSSNYSYTSRYSLRRSRPRAAEGSDFDITLVTANVSDTTTVPYTITGVDSADIDSVSLTGNFTINNNLATQTFTASEDATAEAPETFTLTLDVPGDSVSVQIVDAGFQLATDQAQVAEGYSFTISLSAAGAIDGALIPYTITGVSSSDINGESLTGNFLILNEQSTKTFTATLDLVEDPDETFTITLDNFPSATVSVTFKEPTYSLSRSASAVNEGQSFTITLNTTFLENNTLVPYTITGVSSSDISGASLTGNFTILGNSAVQNFTVATDFTTEGPETFTLSLDNGKGSVLVSINDTSQTPTYELSRSASAVNEGQSFTITLTTTNLPNSSTVSYSISGVSSADIGGANLTGNFTVNNNSAEITFNVTADQTTEGTETFLLTLENVSTPTAIGVTINDTSLTPALSLQRQFAQINEGGTFLIYLYTQNIPDGTLIPYTITGVSSNDIFASLTGNFEVVSNYDELVIPTRADATTEGDETFTITLDEYPSVSTSVVIIDSSRTPTYTLSRSASSVNEGQSFTITLTTTDVSDATTIPYTITGVSSADINNASLTGNFTISSNSASLTVNVTADYATDGTETFTLAITAGTNPSISVTINDTTVFGTLAYTISSIAFTDLLRIGGSYMVASHTSLSPGGAGAEAYGYIDLWRLSDGTRLTFIQNRGVATTTQYGQALWTNGSNIAVGAWNDQQFGAGASQGIVYVYQIVSNGQGLNLVNATSPNYYGAAGGEQNGRSLDGNQTTLLIGSPGEQSFASGTWTAGGGWIQRSNSSGQSAGSVMNPNSNTSSAVDSFGQSVAISPNGNYFAVGAYQEDNSFTYSGSVYLYNSAGTLLTRFDGGAANRALGVQNSLAMNNDYLCIADLLEGNGRVRVISLSDYSVRNIDNPQAVANSTNFGWKLRMNSTHVAIPAKNNAGPTSGYANEGAVYYYKLSDLTLTKTFEVPTADRAQFNSRSFGSAIECTDSRLAVYAPGSAKVYMFGLSA